MIDRLEAMAILRETVDRGSFTAAAKGLGLPLPTVSRKIAELEAHIGTRLLLRTTRKMALTQAGAAYLAAARRILEAVEAAEEAAAGELGALRGELVLTAPILFGRLHILPLVGAFLRAYPQITIRLLLADRNLDLIDDHVDMAVRIGALPDSSMIATRIGSMRLVVCASPALLAAHGEPRSPAELVSLPSIAFEAPGSSSLWRFRGRDGSAAVETAPTPRLSVTTAEAAVFAATEGLGVTRVLHYQCASALSSGALRIVLREFEPEPVPVSLVHAARGALPARMRAFLDFAADPLRQELRTLPA